MTSCGIDTTEGRHVVTCNIPGAFLQADYPEDQECILRFDGPMVKMICTIDPSYGEHVHRNKFGKLVLYARLNKAVYGTFLAALLFCDKLRQQLVDW